MYKVTFQDGKTASLQRINGQFTLAEPALTDEAHAALCLFLPSEIDQYKFTLPKSTVTFPVTLHQELKPDDTVLVKANDGYELVTVIKVSPGAIDVSLEGTTYTFHPAAVIKVLPREERHLDDLKQGDKLRVTSLPAKNEAAHGDELKLGDVITFRMWMTNLNFLKTSEGAIYHYQHFQKA